MVDDQEINPNNYHQNVYKYIFFVFCLMPVEHGMPMRKKNVKKKKQKTKFVLGSDCRVQIGVGVGHYLSCRLYKYFIEYTACYVNH